MDQEEPTQATQNTQAMLDPRRMGRNNSGLSAADVSDVMCILHPCSPAAFRIVAAATAISPQNVLQNDGMHDYLYDVPIEEQETFIIGAEAPQQAMDLALRFSTRIKNPALGFMFGRNDKICDIVLDADTFKRVSNAHFSIFVNNSGVLMLRDMSTNGTIVDDVLLRGKKDIVRSRRMLSPGSVIQILSPKADDIVKFIVRIPSREGHVREYERKFKDFMHRAARAQLQAPLANAKAGLEHDNEVTQTGPSVNTVVQNQHGMHWSGGETYNVIGSIGKGAFATVFQLATKSEGQLFAAKELEKRRFIKNGILDRKLDNEMQIMKSVNHKHIVQYVDYVDYHNHMYIIMEFVPYGDLQHFLSNQIPLPEKLGKIMATQVLDALSYLHSRQITHRDIKPDNILIADANPESFFVKLSDFGLSKVVKDNETFLKTFCGTLLYCAPEVFPHYDAHVVAKGRKRPRSKGGPHPSSKFHSYSQSVDIWSFGAVLWYALCLKPPFEGAAENQGRGMFDTIMLTPLDTTDLVRQRISEEAISLLVSMLNTDPAARPLPYTCLRHKWFGHAQTDAATDAMTHALRGLGAINEEDEAIEEPDVASLSLDEREAPHDSGQSELSIHSGSLDFLDLRESKRFKTDFNNYRDPAEKIDSSSDVLYQSVPILHQPDSAAENQPKKKLFGEISQTDLSKHAIHLRRSSDALGDLLANDVTQGELADDESFGPEGSAAQRRYSSLLGTESLVRELKMDSPQSVSLTDSDPEPLNTPSKPHSQASPVTGKRLSNPVLDNLTPKPPSKPVFDRQIRLEKPASFYYEANDPATHTLEYATKVSGHNYLSNSSSVSTTANSDVQAISGTDEDEPETAVPHPKSQKEDIDNFGPLLTLPNPAFLKPPPRLGRLISTEDSFASITLNLTRSVTVWGRNPSNTDVYPDIYDVRVPKRGILIVFHAEGIDKYADTDDSWTKLPDLHCVVMTESRRGILVNGVLLKDTEPGKRAFGRIHTGDEIIAVSGHRERLKFVCEIYQGLGSVPRSPDAPRFVIENGNPGNRKNEEKNGKENVEEMILGHVRA